jgi:hypothetical protein
MAYDPTDPRSQMVDSKKTMRTGIPRQAQYRELHVGELHVDSADEHHNNGSSTWWTRSQSVVVAYTETRAGDELSVDSSAEYIVLALSKTPLTITHASGSVHITEASVVIVPAGPSTVAIGGNSDVPASNRGTVVRLFSAEHATDLAALCKNNAEYAEPDSNVAPFRAWPDSPEGLRIRVYPIAKYPFDPERLGRIFRCSTLMVNVFHVDDQPRDPTKLSPHFHDDFEQISLQIEGDYVHHMRTPWTPNASTWADDEHRLCNAPAIVVIPPLLIHTSQSISTMPHWLIDVFGPPRKDFSDRPGWVLNANEYPMPDR